MINLHKWLLLSLLMITHPCVIASTYIEQGDAALAQSNIAQAIQYYQAEIRNTPDSIPAKLGLVQAYLVTRKTEYAKSILDTVLVQAPNSIDALLVLARYCIYENKLDEAEKTLKQVITLDSKNIPAHASLAQVYMAKGDYLQEETVNTTLTQLQKNQSLVK